jgi:hypothetical protein
MASSSVPSPIAVPVQVARRAAAGRPAPRLLDTRVLRAGREQGGVPCRNRGVAWTKNAGSLLVRWPRHALLPRSSPAPPDRH